LAEELKRKFDQSPFQKYDRIFVCKKPFQARALKEKWYEIYGKPLNVDSKLVPPLQPEIDMIFCKKKEMTAVELKYFQRKGNGLNHSFYEGIEQALALLRWGFDYVALWHLYASSITKEELWFYGGWTWWFIQTPHKYGGLGLPLEFTFMKVRITNQGYDFPIIQPRWKTRPIELEELRPPYDPSFQMTSPHPNPLTRDPQVKELRTSLEKWLSISHS